MGELSSAVSITASPLHPDSRTAAAVTAVTALKMVKMVVDLLWKLPFMYSSYRLSFNKNRTQHH